MKNFTRVVCLAISMFIYMEKSYSQITVTQSDMPQAGNIIVVDSDLAPTVTPGSAGPSQNWNFSGLNNSRTVSLDFVTPGSTPYASSFPGANLADSTIGYPGYNYFLSQASAFSVVGGMPIIMGYQVNIHFNPYYEQTALPATYGTTDGGYTHGVSDALPFSYLGSDSGKGTISITYADTIDAWGTIQTPSGTYNVLRQKHYEVDVDSVFLHYSFPSSHWTFVQSQTTKTHQYRWYANGLGYTLVQMQMDTTNTKVLSVAWYDKPAGINEVSNQSHTIVYPNPCTSQANFLCPDKQAKVLSVFDVTGRRISQTAITNGTAAINTSSLSKGIYFFRTTDALGNTISRGKFSVQ